MPELHDKVHTMNDVNDSVDTGSGVPAILLQVSLARATDLACAGRYSEAETLLLGITKHGKPAPAALDLLARINAQQDKLQEAERLWTQACALDSGNEAYRAGLQYIARMSRRPVRIAFTMPLMVGIIAVLGIITAGVAVNMYGWNFSAPLERNAGTPEGATSRLGMEQPPTLNINVDGVTLKTVGNELIVTFDEGLFARGTHLRSGANKILRTLGQQLYPHVDRIALRVIGHTDDIPVSTESVYRDNGALGMARAATVVASLRAGGNLPSKLFLIGSHGELQGPYANDTPDNRYRNRTVVLWISSKKIS